MERCYISEQIAKHCDEPEEVFCPFCDANMLDNNGDLECMNDECGHIIHAPDEDCFIDYEEY